jgi:dTDP-4-dehydrorhamnose reductase
MKKLLITGASGKLGSCLRVGLEDSGKYEVIAADLKPNPQTGVIMLDVTDAKVIKYLEALIGYKPQDDASKMMEELYEKNEQIPQGESEYQGGVNVEKGQKSRFD